MKEKLLNLKKKVLKYSPNVYFEAIEKNGKNCDFFYDPISQPLYLPQIFKKYIARRKILNSFPTESFMCKTAYTLIFNL